MAAALDAFLDEEPGVCDGPIHSMTSFEAELLRAYDSGVRAAPLL
jgi:hypothetical protein